MSASADASSSSLPLLDTILSFIRRSSSGLSSSTSVTDADEKQTEISRSSGNIWSAIRTGDLELLKSLLKTKPELIKERGPGTQSKDITTQNNRKRRCDNMAIC